MHPRCCEKTSWDEEPLQRTVTALYDTLGCILYTWAIRDTIPYSTYIIYLYMWCYWLEIWNYQYKNKFDQLAALFLVFFLSLFASPVRLLLVVPASQVLFCIFSLRGSRWTPGAGCFTVHRTTNLDEFASLRDLAVFFLGGKIFEFPTFFGTKRELTVSSPKKWPFFWVGSRLLACVSSCWAMSMRRGKFWNRKSATSIGGFSVITWKSCFGHFG